MKIAYIFTPITFGGAEKVSLNFLQTVDRKRFDIHPILLTRPWEDESFFAREIQRFGYAYDTVPVALKPCGGPMRVPRVAWRLYSLLKQRSFDLVHTHGYFADICGLPVARLLGVTSISTCHGFIENDFKLCVYNQLDKYALRFCKTIIAVSEGIKTELVRSGIKDSSIVVIPNAVPPPCGEDEFQGYRLEKRISLGISPDEYVIGYVGRLSEEKGLIYLIEAAAKLRDVAVAAKLLIVGDGPEKMALELLVRERKLENGAIFVGFQMDIEKWLPAFDAFILPSLSEGTPLALLEAMAMGVPVIASAVGGVPKVVSDGVNGLLVPPGKIEALSEKIILLKNDPATQKRLSIEGLETIKEKYDICPWCRNIEKLYSEV